MSKTDALASYDQFLPGTEAVKKAKSATYSGGARRINTIGEIVCLHLMIRPGKDPIVGAKRHFCKIDSEKTVSFFCPGPTCYLCNTILPQLRDSKNPNDRAKADYDERDNWLPKAYYVVNAVIKGEEERGPQAIELQSKFVTEQINVRLNRAAREGNPFDPLGARKNPDGSRNPGGYWFDIEVVQDGKFTKQTLQIATDGSAYRPLAVTDTGEADMVQIKAWVDGQPDLEHMTRPKTYAEIKRMFTQEDEDDTPSAGRGAQGYVGRKPDPENINVRVEPDGDKSEDDGDDIPF
jgi:hypothetical protein